MLVEPSNKVQHKRTVIINGHQTNKFISNIISTAKYNVFTFLPKFLWEKIRCYANAFFLIVATLQQIPNVSPTGRFTTAVPLGFILMVSAIKELIEDFNRHRADDATNKSKVLVYREDKFTEVEWRHVQVGEIVKITNNHGIPADVVLLSSSEPYAMCYIETSNLDGETNLKLRQGLSSTSSIVTMTELEHFHGKIECQFPTRTLDEFAGVIIHENGESFPLTPTQLLLRGSSLKNTKWIYGVVIYTGMETKVMLNSTSAPLKQSRVDKITNKYILVLFGLLLFLTLSSAISNYIWSKSTGSLWYLGYENIDFQYFLYMTMSFFIVFHTIIPISLQVTLETIRYIQALFINWDIEMYCHETDTPAMARTSNLNEELGEVKYIFSDKTGTLTQNVMEFRACSIAGSMYSSHSIADNNLQTKDLKAFLASKDPDGELFFQILSTCHTVVPEVDEDTGKITFQASSPDENALVKIANALNYKFTSRTPEDITVNIYGEDLLYQVLHVIEFTSDRKRMSVIVRTPNNKIHLYCKGADSVIYERLSESAQNTSTTLAHLEDFAQLGLRTLCIAYREIPESVYAEWSARFVEATKALEHREEKIAQTAEEIEKELLLVGATAIEDKLQDGVPETIANLSRAGINLWVLTGDKKETAVNIGYSCKLLTDQLELLVISGSEHHSVSEQLQTAANGFAGNLRTQHQYALIIDGKTLEVALGEPCHKHLLDVCLSCKVVVCCRVSPWQKAEIVRLVKTNVKDTITLAIGDGANDVGMIQEAHVGIGISGKEGLQAACASDYAIAQFRFLEKLLLVHGAWNYSRITKVIFYSFYKNVCLFLIQFWFAFRNGFSGQILFERWSIGFYNLFFTSAPPLALGLFDRNVRMVNCLKYPELYTETMNSASFNVKTFACWMVNSVFHSIVLYWIPEFIFNHDIFYSNGQTGSLLVMGNCVYTYVVITVCLKAGLEHTAWTWLSHLAIWGSISCWFLFLLIYTQFYPTFNLASVLVGMESAVLGCPLFWLGLLVIPSIALVRDITWKIMKRSVHQNLRERVMLMEEDDRDPSSLIPTTRSRQFGRHILRRSKVLKIFRGRGKSSQKSEEMEMGEEPPLPADHGFAFSQEEHGVVSQNNIIRAYDSRHKKPSGS